MSPEQKLHAAVVDSTGLLVAAGGLASSRRLLTADRTVAMTDEGISMGQPESGQKITAAKSILGQLQHVGGRL